jgi:hypothetical protein
VHLVTRLESGNHKQLVKVNRLCLSSTNRMAPAAASQAAQHAQVRTQPTESKAVSCCICHESASCKAHRYDCEFFVASASHLWRLCSHNPVSLPKPICDWPMLTTLFAPCTMTSQHSWNTHCALHKSLGLVCTLASLPPINTHTHTSTAERRLWTETEKGRVG